MKPCNLRISALFIAVAATAATAASAAVPAGRYTFPATGTVLDTKTKLTWQQAPATGTFSWASAKTYCAAQVPVGWRLPTVKELETLVDDSRVGPAIDPTAFPATPSSAFWSSSTVAGQPGLAWEVIFYYGNTDTGDATHPFNVRCVR